MRYAGDGIACVAAENETALKQGLDAIVVELEELPGVFDPMTALDPATTIVGETPRDAPEFPRGNLVTHYIVRKGDPQSELASCPVILEEDYSTLHQEHAYIETEGAIAIPAPENSGVTVYAPCQSPFLNRANLMRTLGLGEDNIRVIQPHVGGAFGGKDDLMYQISGQVAKLALLTGRAVKMILSREESIIASYKRDAMHIQLKLGAQTDGKLRACQVNATVDSGSVVTRARNSSRSSANTCSPNTIDVRDANRVRTAWQSTAARPTAR